MKKILIGILFCFLLSLSLYATEPEFIVESNSNHSFGRYYGTVKRTYVNKDNMILLYYDTHISDDTLNLAQQNHDTNLTRKDAAAFNIDENPQFAKFLYATLLT